MIDTVYHVGNLAVDREGDAKLDREAADLLHLCELGKAILYQRRLTRGPKSLFAYHVRHVPGA